MPIEEQVKQLEWELKEAKRKARKDAGVKRLSYNTLLPKKYLSILRGAASRGIDFNLTVEQCEQIFKMNCVYCGTSNRVGIDRIDSDGDYESDNVQPCCTTCNLMKRALSHDAFIKHITLIYSKTKQPFK